MNSIFGPSQGSIQAQAMDKAIEQNELKKEQDELRKQEALRRQQNQKIQQERLSVLKRNLGGSSVDTSSDSLLG
jgi:hypothetical protein